MLPAGSGTRIPMGVFTMSFSSPVGMLSCSGIPSWRDNVPFFKDALWIHLSLPIHIKEVILLPPVIMVMPRAHEWARAGRSHRGMRPGYWQ